jgi:2-amino-4-hydroxy-6-hydroxymethyldihydropteridine diphosphokinase
MNSARRSIGRAISGLSAEGVRIIKRSSLYKTEPVGLTDQPWFTNQVIGVETPHSPREMLHLAKSIEAAMGRRSGLRNGPRPIDIDILLAGETVLQTPDLEIPHPRLVERNFVLIPLAEIAPGTVHPVLRKTVRKLLEESLDRSQVIRLGR